MRAKALGDSIRSFTEAILVRTLTYKSCENVCRVSPKYLPSDLYSSFCFRLSRGGTDGSLRAAQCPAAQNIPMFDAGLTFKFNQAAHGLLLNREQAQRVVSLCQKYPFVAVVERELSSN